MSLIVPSDGAQGVRTVVGIHGSTYARPRMTMTFAVVTPSYRNDWPLFISLHESVLLHTPEPVTHYVIVPGADVQLFSQVAGPRCVVIPEESLYPRHYRPLPGANQLLHSLPRVPSAARLAAINLGRPFHPIRGWVMQQVLKME